MAKKPTLPEAKTLDYDAAIDDATVLFNRTRIRFGQRGGDHPHAPEDTRVIALMAAVLIGAFCQPDPPRKVRVVK
jgi:hypothetical protein